MTDEVVYTKYKTQGLLKGPGKENQRSQKCQLEGKTVAGNVPQSTECLSTQVRIGPEFHPEPYKLNLMVVVV